MKGSLEKVSFCRRPCCACSEISVLHTDSCERYDVENRSKDEQELMICAILFDPRYKDGHLLLFFFEENYKLTACCD